MQDSNGYSFGTSRSTERRYLERRYSDRFTDEDIDRMLRNAAVKVGKFVMPQKAERKES